MAFDSPIEIPCRWDTDIDVLKSYNGTLTAVLNGREVVLSGSILFPLNYTLVEEGYVYLGTLSSLTPEAQLDPTYAPNVREIIKVTTTPFMGADVSNNEDLFKMVYI
jgi:hypothetical protein